MTSKQKSKVNDDSEANHQQSKVKRVIVDRGLGDIGSELEHHWTADDNAGMSLRELEDFFNQRVLHEAMENAGMQVLDGEAENLYKLLTSDEVSAGSRVRAERRLEREEIDTESLTSDFVSHQAIHTYLTKYRDASAPESNVSENPETEQDTIHRLQNRMVAVTANSLRSLREKERITLGDFDVIVNIQIRCSDCGTQLTVSEIFNRGGCEC
ncbi:hypothetical protein KY092_13690 [Natronomonas gomsonensis]|uniref:rod-determining factor RdfA n=1 Tax=Natronomonas gomsonensis TaxID=1046043 RepID=UPI0020CA8A1C|nr:rod-determining factor RdfA [Natronomonas gomsonensis]MCY4731606.1 hypothetical protein [Natronomonas gomsonensis]